MPRVLIIEPAEGLRNDLAAAVRRAGYLSDAVSDSREALLQFASIPADIILANVAGPEDLSFLDSMARAAPELPIVAMGADPSVEASVEAMKRGARDFLRKPFSIASLEAALTAAQQTGNDRHSRPLIVTGDPTMQRLLREAEAVATTNATVQIVGESGTGKGLLARFIHAHSPRKNGPFVEVKCGGLAESFAERELFGHESVGLTGASESSQGRVLAADGGSLLLDELDAMEPWLQQKLLHVIQEREVLTKGSKCPRPVDVRIIGTTRTELHLDVAAGRFREDLYYRLDVIVLRIPPLRERRGDLSLLTEDLLNRFAESSGREPPRLSPRAIERLSRHHFRGNVRELENLMRRAMVLFPGREVDADQLLHPAAAISRASAPRSFNLKQIERDTIVESLAETSGNRTRAARALGISVRTLRNKIHLYDLA